MLYSESPSRFVVTIAPENRERFESMMEGGCSLVGRTTEEKSLVVMGLDGGKIMNVALEELKNAYKGTFREF